MQDRFRDIVFGQQENRKRQRQKKLQQDLSVAVCTWSTLSYQDAGFMALPKLGFFVSVMRLQQEFIRLSSNSLSGNLHIGRQILPDVCEVYYVSSKLALLSKKLVDLAPRRLWNARKIRNTGQLRGSCVAGTSVRNFT